MDKLFYIIYNLYYKHGNFKNDIPPLTVLGIFLVFFFSLTMSAVGIIGALNNPDFVNPKLNKAIILLITIAYGFLIYILFYKNNRYKRIYEKYKAVSYLNTAYAKYLGLLALILGILSPLVFGIVKNQIVLGRWIA